MLKQQQQELESIALRARHGSAERCGPDSFPCWNASTACNELVAGLNFQGNDLRGGSVPASNAEECCLACKLRGACAAFTFITSDSVPRRQSCWLKDSRFASGATRSGGTTSGVVLRLADPAGSRTLSEPAPHLHCVASAWHRMRRRLNTSIASELSIEDRREAVGLGLLPPEPSGWCRAPDLGHGGAVVILSQRRRYLWQDVLDSCRMLHVVQAKTASIGESRNRTLPMGALGVFRAHVLAWELALRKGWSWALVLEDDAAFSHGSRLQLLALLPTLIEGAENVDPEWSLVVLSRIATRKDSMDQWPFWDTAVPRWWRTRPPRAVAGTGWNRIDPTLTSLAWTYRRPLLNLLVRAAREAFESPAPRVPLAPLDTWVFKAMPNESRAHLLAPMLPMVGEHNKQGSLRIAVDKGRHHSNKRVRGY